MEVNRQAMVMEEAAYRRLQSAWISSNTGSTMLDTLTVNLPLPLMVFFACAFLKNVPCNLFLYEFTILVIPLVVNLTVLSYSVHLIPILISIAILLSSLSFKTQCSLQSILTSVPEKRTSWITNFRACTSLISVICIFAVDLNIFPRKFAKTEMYGFGLMDLGVGIYVICHGLVYKANDFKKEVQAILVTTFLGIIRLVSIKMIGYHQHITEYGEHWNFFFTLATCSLLLLFVREVFQSSNFALLTLATCILHHTILSSGGQDWVMSSRPRVSIWEANKEGLASILGYATLYHASITYSKLTMNQTVGKTLSSTIILSTILWLGTYACAHYTGISRRLCNVGYIAWTCAVASTMAVLLMQVDIILKWKSSCPRVPNLLQALNRRGLLFFLIGNIFTGIININLQTLLLSTWQSYGILVLYCLSVTSLTFALDNKFR